MTEIAGDASLVRRSGSDDAGQPKEEPKAGSLFAALRRYRDPPAAAATTAQPSSPTRAAEEGQQPTVMDRAHSGPAPAALQAARQEDASRRSWFNRLSGVYTVAERQIARGAKALQKLAVPAGRLHDYTEARERLERAAAQLRGQDRLLALRRWVAVLTVPEQAPGAQPVIVAQPMIVAQPVSPSSSSGRGAEEEDWQQLSALPIPSVSSSAAERDSSPRVSPPLFVDRSAGAESQEPMTFRELFLRSNALESILAGYAQEGPSSQEEEELLSQLVSACFGSTPEGEGDELLGHLLALAGAQAQCAASGVPEKQIQDISSHVGSAVRSLKQQAGVEMLDRKMAALRDEIAEQAATAALLHKFNSGVSEPTGEVTHQRILQGITATREVMQLVESLCKLAGERSSLIADAPAPGHAELLDAMDQRSVALTTAISEADVKIADTQVQRRDGEEARERKLKEMGSSMAEIQEEIQGLQAERATLLSQLEKVELALTKAQTRRADLEEERNVNEEGSNFTMEALQHQADELSNLQLQCESEAAAVAKCRQLVSRAQHTQRQMQQEELNRASLAVLEVAREYSHAAARHLYFRRAQLQLLLRQLNFCASELSGNVAKQERVTSLGMDSLLPDVALQQHRLMQQYLDAEAGCHAHLEQVAAVRDKVQSVTSVAEASAALGAEAIQQPGEAKGQGLVPKSAELQDLFKSIEALKADLEGFKRPDGLPPPGEKLPALPDPLKLQAEEAASPATSREPSTTSSHGPARAPQVAKCVPEAPVEASSNSQTSTGGVQGTPVRTGPSHENELGLEDLLDSLDSAETSEYRDQPEPTLHAAPHSAQEDVVDGSLTPLSKSFSSEGFEAEPREASAAVEALHASEAATAEPAGELGSSQEGLLSAIEH